MFDVETAVGILGMLGFLLAMKYLMNRLCGE